MRRGLVHDKASVVVNEISPGKRNVFIEAKDPELHNSRRGCAASYINELKDETLQATGSAELRRLAIIELSGDVGLPKNNFLSARSEIQP